MIVLADWQPVRQGLGWLGLAAVGAWIPPAWFAASALRKENVVSVVWRGRLPGWPTVIAGAVILLAIRAGWQGEWLVGALALGALGLTALAWRPGLRPGLTAASVGLAVGAGGCVDFGRNEVRGEWVAIALGFGLAAVLPVLARRWVGAGASGCGVVGLGAGRYPAAGNAGAGCDDAL